MENSNLKIFICLCFLLPLLVRPPAVQAAETYIEPNSDAIYQELNGIDRSSHRAWRQTVGTKPVALTFDELNAKHDLKTRNDHCPVYFGQANAQPRFTAGGSFPRLPLKEIVRKLKAGELVPDDLPIQFVWVDGKRVTYNNRSLTALYMAGMHPTQVIDVTNHPGEEFNDLTVIVLKRLEGMAGKPSTEMLVRADGMGADGQPKTAADWDAPIGEVVSMPKDLLAEALSCEESQTNHR